MKGAAGSARVSEHGAGARGRRTGASTNSGYRWGRLLPAAALLLAACQQLFGRDAARCEQSAATVRQAITLQDFESARSWRDYTWKVCDDHAIVTGLDKEILDGEAARATQTQARLAARQLAQARINAAQKTWLAFDAEPASERTREKLEAARKSADALAQGLEPEYGQKLQAYDTGEYDRRLVALAR